MKKTLSNLKLATILPFVILLAISTSLFAQEKYHASALSLTINGTSTLHDWEIVSTKGNAEAIISVNDNKVAFNGLSLVIPAESLKSGHDLMDKNTYKALNTDKNPNISFVLSSGNLIPAGNNTYQFKGVGKLTIAGTTVLTDLVGTVRYNPEDKSYICAGTKKFKMTQYGVKPPTVMMGTIKTGDDISVSYSLVIKGQG